jgi:tRNA (guanine-N7-)-methyltransferase
MRIRHKPWAKPELEACPFYIAEPQEQKGKWYTLFEDSSKPLYVNLAAERAVSFRRQHLHILR